MTISPATTPAHFDVARDLFREYQQSLNLDLCFQSFEQELATLPGRYAPPRGILLLAFNDPEVPVGCIALRPIDDSICEMKRLYVRPVARGHNLGRRLISAVIDHARAQGFTSMRLDTLPGPMDNAIALYREFGFRQTPPYYENPFPVLFLELAL